MFFDPTQLDILIAMTTFFTLIIDAMQNVLTQTFASLIAVIVSLLVTVFGGGA